MCHFTLLQLALAELTIRSAGSEQNIADLITVSVMVT